MRHRSRAPAGLLERLGSLRVPGWLLCLLLMGLASLVRIVLMRTLYARVDSDQAIVGLMAYHILGGDRPTFYYGQPYQGSLEAFLAAAAFRIWGASDFTLRLPALTFSVAFVGAIYALADTLYGRRIAVYAGLYLALGPALLQFFGMAAGFGYMEAMVFGTLLLLVAVFYPDLRTMPWPAALACGLLSGLGVWAEPIFGEYLVAVVLALGARLLSGDASRGRADQRGLARNVVAISLGVLVGSAPLLAYNLQHRWETLAFLHARGLGGDHLAVVERAVTESFPILLGLITPTISGPAFAHQLSVHPVRHLVGILIGGVVVGWLILDPRCLPRRIAALVRPLAPARGRAPTADTAGRDGVLALFAVSCLACFVFTRFGADPWAARLPRYLLPLYTIAPLVLDCFIPRNARPFQRLAPPIVIGMLLVAGLIITVTEVPHPADPTAVAGVAFTAADIDSLDALLERDGVRVVYTSYWLANRISFETHERIVGVAVKASFRLAQNRLPGYLIVAARTPPSGLAWIFQAGSRDNLAFRALLHRAGASAIRTDWRGLAVYTGFTRPLRAPLAVS